MTKVENVATSTSMFYKCLPHHSHRIKTCKTIFLTLQYVTVKHTLSHARPQKRFMNVKIFKCWKIMISYKKKYKENQYESMKKIMIFLTYGNINLFKKTKLKHVQIIKNQCFDIILQVFGKKISTYSITQSPLKSMYKNPKIKNFLKVKMYAQKPPAGLRSTCGAKFLNFYVFFVFFAFF